MFNLNLADPTQRKLQNQMLRKDHSQFGSLWGVVFSTWKQQRFSHGFIITHKPNIPRKAVQQKKNYHQKRLELAILLRFDWYSLTEGYRCSPTKLLLSEAEVKRSALEGEVTVCLLSSLVLFHLSLKCLTSLAVLSRILKSWALNLLILVRSLTLWNRVLECARSSSKLFWMKWSFWQPFTLFSRLYFCLGLSCSPPALCFFLCMRKVQLSSDGTCSSIFSNLDYLNSHSRSRAALGIARISVRFWLALANSYLVCLSCLNSYDPKILSFSREPISMIFSFLLFRILTCPSNMQQMAQTPSPFLQMKRPKSSESTEHSSQNSSFSLFLSPRRIAKSRKNNFLRITSVLRAIRYKTQALLTKITTSQSCIRYPCLKRNNCYPLQTLRSMSSPATQQQPLWSQQGE